MPSFYAFLSGVLACLLLLNVSAYAARPVLLRRSDFGRCLLRRFPLWRVAAYAFWVFAVALLESPLSDDAGYKGE